VSVAPHANFPLGGLNPSALAFLTKKVFKSIEIFCFGVVLHGGKLAGGSENVNLFFYFFFTFTANVVFREFDFLAWEHFPRGGNESQTLANFADATDSAVFVFTWCFHAPYLSHPARIVNWFFTKMKTALILPSFGNPVVTDILAENFD